MKPKDKQLLLQDLCARLPFNGEPFPALYNSQDWLNAYHFDHRGLIERGIAKVLSLKRPKECIIKIYEDILNN